jgi:hypothetical protein
MVGWGSFFRFQGIFRLATYNEVASSQFGEAPPASEECRGIGAFSAAYVVAAVTSIANAIILMARRDFLGR